MNARRPFVSGIGLLGVLAWWLLRRVRDEYATERRLTLATSGAADALYALHAALTLLAARRHQLATTGTVAVIARVCGLLLAVLGHVLFLAGLREMRSPSTISGLATDGLVTTGVYRRSRNP